MLATIVSHFDKQKNILTSPKSDKFTYKSVNIKDLTSLYHTLATNYILNINLNISGAIELERSNPNFNTLYSKKFDYIFFNIDCNKRENKDFILDYFKEYNSVIGKSRSYDDFTNFNLRVVLQTEVMSFDDTRVVLAKIQYDLKDYCQISDDTIKKGYYTAPIMRVDTITEISDKIVFPKLNNKVSDFIPKADISLKNKLVLENSTDLNMGISAFTQLGYKIVSQNNNIINFTKDGENYYLYDNNPFLMNHKNRQKSLNIYSLVKSIQGNGIDYSQFFEEPKSDILNEQFLIPTNKEKKLEKFFHKPKNMLIIKSPMGSGKSELIKEIIQKAHAINERVLIVTNRISIAEEFKGKYGLKIYNQDKYTAGSSMIVQYDSLYKYNMKNFDLVILDEFMSLLIHSRTNISQNPVNLTKFFECFDKRLVIADAFINGYEKHLIFKPEKNIVTLINSFKDKSTLYSIKTKSLFFDLVLEKSLEAKKFKKIVTISSTSINMIEALSKFLEFNGLKNQVLTADTPAIIKDTIYKKFKNKRQDYDVLIYSPTITCGVSILSDSDNHFHYDSSHSTDPISSLQMIKRARKAQNIYYYIQPGYETKILNYEALREQYIKNVTINPKNNHLFEYNKYNELNLSKTGQRAVRIDLLLNILESNRKNVFEYFLKYNFENNPIKLDEVGKADVDYWLSNSKLNSSDELLDEKIDNYFEILNLNLDIKSQKEKSKFITLLDTLYNKTNLNFEYSDHQNLFKELFKLYVNDNQLFQKIECYKDLESQISDTRLKYKLSEAITNPNKSDKFEFYNLLNETQFKLNISELNNIDYVKNLSAKCVKILEYAGFKIKNKRVEYPVNIIKFKDYIRNS